MSSKGNFWVNAPLFRDLTVHDCTWDTVKNCIFFAEYWMFLQCPTQACFHPHTKSNWVSLLFSTSFDISLLGNLTRICVPLQNKILVLCTYTCHNQKAFSLEYYIYFYFLCKITIQSYKNKPFLIVCSENICWRL